MPILTLSFGAACFRSGYYLFIRLLFNYILTCFGLVEVFFGKFSCRATFSELLTLDLSFFRLYALRSCVCLAYRVYVSDFLCTCVIYRLYVNNPLLLALFVTYTGVILALVLCNGVVW